MPATMLIVMLMAFALSVPIAVALALAALIGMAGFTSLPMVVYPQQLYVAIDKYPLVAVPLFILAGNLMQYGGISRRLIDVARALVGSLPGGLGAACVVTCMIFAAISGSGVATTFAVGAIMIPALRRQGYPAPFAASLQASSAELGVIIPPSIPMILYAVSAEVSVGSLFLAGIGPGLLIAASLIGFVMLWSWFTGMGAAGDSDAVALWSALWRAAPSLSMPVIVLGGIYGGIFTPTEAAAVAVFYALFIGLVVHREIKLADLADVLRRSLASTSAIMLIISAAGVFSYLVTLAGVPAAIGSWLVETFDNRLLFLLAVNCVLFLIGMFIETSASIIILAPILAPVALHFGIDPIHFGVIMVVNLALGMITPPFGVNLFAACQVARLSMDEIVPSLLIFVGIIAACLLVVTYVPSISLFILG